MKLTSSSSYISGLPVRDLLKKIQFKSNDSDILIALSTVCGTSTETFEARKNSHLTNSTEMDHQIRFPLKDRVERSLTKLATACATQMIQQNVLVIEAHVKDIDYQTNFIFKILTKMGITINLVAETEISDSILTSIEIDVLKNLPKYKNQQKNITHYARERIYSGDYQTAYLILSEITVSERLDVHHQLLGLCCNFFGRTDESEIHFTHMLASNNLISKIKATYVLSMLYLRLHSKEKQNLEIAEKFLTDGHQLIEKNPSIEDYYFHSVFNRNGYALCLFRRGQVEQALTMLDAGIKKLQFSDDGAKQLHQSVLIYNAVQCLKNLNRFEDCEHRCLDLLKIDSLFPEYWLELAVVYLEQDKYSQALEALAEAEKLDSFIPEIFALKGYLFLNQESIPQAIENYSKAVQLAPTNPQYKNDLQYCIEAHL